MNLGQGTRTITMQPRVAVLCFSSLCYLCLCGESLRANPPVASYIFPAGGQRGSKVDVRVGGLFLHQSCRFEMLGLGVEASKELKRTRTRWFEGPMLSLPDSQQAEDYPQDTAGSVTIAPDAEMGLRRARLWTAEGAASGLLFQVGDFPEIVEEEIDGDPVPVEVKLPVTINGRIFPRQNVDVWTVTLTKGQTVSCEVYAARLGSPLDSLLEVVDPSGRIIAENDDTFGADSFVRFTAATDGKYQVRIRDANSKGGQAYVYRLSLTTGPYIDRVFPLGVKRDSRSRVQLFGHGLPQEGVEIEVPKDVQSLVYRYSAEQMKSNPVVLDVDDLPQYVGRDLPVKIPCAANGRIDKPGNVDSWAFMAKKGEVFQIELRAAQLGSLLQGVLTVCDAAGKELGRAEATGAQLDPTLTFTAPAEGEYTVRVAERFRNRGGPAFAYRLRLTPPPSPGFKLHLAADAVTVPRGGSAKLRINVDRIGNFPDAIPLTIDGLPPGVKANPTAVALRQNSVEIVLAAEKEAAIDSARLTIRSGEQTATFAPTVGAWSPDHAPSSVLLAVALPAPFKIVADYDMRWASRGTVFKRKYKIERNGFDGPIEVSLADRQARHLQGVTGQTITVPPDVSEFEYPVQLPPWMETGRTCRVCVQAVGVVKEGDKSYTVSFSAVSQNDQMIAVVETGRLGVEAEKASLTAKRGGSATLAVKVARGKNLTGPVKVELVLPGHVRGVKVEPVTIAADQSRGTLTLKFDREALGPFNMPLVVRATLTDASGPVVAETKVEIVPDD
jgi:hypothetical protein